MPTAAELLDFETEWPRHTGWKEEAIRDRLKITPARFYMLLHRAARTIEGQAHSPITAHRVMRLAR